MKKYLFLVTSYALLLASCNTGTEKPPVEVRSEPSKPTKPRVPVPDFNSDSAFPYEKAQADMGPRIPGSKSHEMAANYFEKKFKEFGAEVIIQKFTATTFDQKKWLGKNIIASF